MNLNKSTHVDNCIPLALRLGPACIRPPADGRDSDPWRRAPALSPFVRSGGAPDPVTDTAASVLWDEDALYIRFNCAEPNPRYRPLSRNDFDSGLDAPQFADMIAIHLRPEWQRCELCRITVASDCSLLADRTEIPINPPAPGAPPPRAPQSLLGISAKVKRKSDSWEVYLTIPWASIGGRPQESFGLNLFRTRWQSSERLSFVPTDFWNAPAPDLCLECKFGGSPGLISAAPDSYVVMPSGCTRWQQPSRLVRPLPRELRNIWTLQETLAESKTTTATLASRVRLAQSWIDLLVLEGFSFHPQGGSWEVKQEEFQPHEARLKVNEALRAGDFSAAAAALDIFLRQLDRASRAWFADGSPCNMRKELWEPVSKLEKVSCRDNILKISCRCGSRRITMCLSVPEPGCMRISGKQTGFFKPAEKPQPLKVSKTPLGWRIEGGGLRILLNSRPFSIGVLDGKGRCRICLGDDFLKVLSSGTGRPGGVMWTLPLTKDEALFGFGERFDALNQRGNVATVHDLDAWEGLFYTLPNQMYKPVQFFHSTHGYSAFLNATGLLRADIGCTDSRQMTLTQHGPQLDLFLWFAAPAETVRSFTALTGRPLLPPSWAFEPWLGGGWERWKKGPRADSAKEILAAVDRFRDADMPHAAVYAEGEAMDDPRSTAWLAPQGVRVLSWMNSTLSLKEQAKLLPDVPEKNLPIVRRKDGSAFPYVDFTHPRAMQLLRAFWKHRLDMGVAGSMVDFGDLVPEDARFHDGRGGLEMHNFYAYDYHRLFAEVFRECRGDDFVLFSRSAAPGSQRWLCQFAGDHQANFVGLSNALRGGLNLSACGFSTWGCDIGGYLAWPDPEVYIRWVQWGCFSPFMRCHGTRPREPWEFGGDAEGIYRFYIWLRHNLHDYLCASAADAAASGLPLMRALPLIWPGEAHLASCDDAYLLGPDLLVAPMHASGESRPLPFPPGRWTCIWTGKNWTGGKTATVPAPLDRIPVFLRSGACLPIHLNARLELGGSMSTGRVGTWVLTPPSEPLERSFEGLAGGPAKVMMKPSGRRQFTIELEGRADARFLLVYGARICEVRSNGTPLPSLAPETRETKAAGWWQEDALAVVKIPHGVRRKVEVTFVSA